MGYIIYQYRLYKNSFWSVNTVQIKRLLLMVAIAHLNDSFQAVDVILTKPKQIRRFEYFPIEVELMLKR